MGNNINGKLGWHEIMSKHIDEIRNSLKLKRKFVADADVKIEAAVQRFFRPDGKKKSGKKQLVLIGIHMR